MNLLFKPFYRNESGFTLLELILSLAIVGIIIALGLGGIRLGVTARDVGEKKANTYQRLRIIAEQLTQKLQSTYPVFVAQKYGVPIAQGRRVMAFEGNSNSLRFVTFSTPITAASEGSWIHEVQFYLGKHPKTEKKGLILMEKEIWEGNIFSRINSNEDSIQYFLLAENVTNLKLRYYEVKKLQTKDVDQFNGLTHSGKWVNSVFMNPFQANQKTPANPLLGFEKANKISLPRAVEISIGLTPKKDEKSNEDQEDPEVIFAPTLVVLLNSGMKIALPEKKEEGNEKA